MNPTLRSFLAHALLACVPGGVCAVIAYYSSGLFYFICMENGGPCRPVEEMANLYTVGGFTFGALLSFVCGSMPDFSDQGKKRPDGF